MGSQNPNFNHFLCPRSKRLFSWFLVFTLPFILLDAAFWVTLWIIAKVTVWLAAQLVKIFPQPQRAKTAMVDDSELQLAARRTREPPKNAGQIYCDHPDCRNHIPYFKRRSDWRCMIPGCNQSFTRKYHVRRHVEEIHQKGKKWMCPYSDCDRSSGNGFARERDLKNHIHHHIHTKQDCFLRAEITRLQWEVMEKDSRLEEMKMKLKQLWELTEKRYLLHIFSFHSAPFLCRV
ncbi:hypothetical protein I7I52_05499 [Histoplasma capsulatum]|uniref:C2H2-type domain-containing protein n=1 Tax=Ajellomyces capsulatus TaxID=5037 RepID=A0A8H8CY40_AJECA|nr:hypothetical protein I7I52_05499 [Histoplasma capsulatum]